MSLEREKTTSLFVAFGLTVHPNPMIVTVMARVSPPRLLVARERMRSQESG
jgi:hypothetical protein